jgi:predicted secreted hydrolase
MLDTLLASQELASSEFVPAYWQGAIGLTGKKNGSPVSGVGYLEMTGFV